MERVLIVDDDKDLRFNISSLLKDEGYEAIAIGDGRRATKEVKAKSPDLVLLDIKLPGMDGIMILEEMKKIDRDLIVIMLTGYGEVKSAVRAMKLGAYDYITKPFDNEELVLTVKKALQTQYLSKEVESLRKRLGKTTSLEEVMGESFQIKQVLKQVEIIAPTNMTVILQGESGTGKELIANMIYQKSPRKEKPFVPIDCGTIPETLVESELFGYEKGAFTGADERKEGKFEQANEGTLFLDEITNFSDSVQMKFLRVLEERKLRHLGGRRDIRIDVRIIVATNINLFEAVQKGRFRNELFHRLNEFHIDLPPLRERKDDISILAKCFLDEANQKLSKKVEKISNEAMKLLLNYHWPGNVRELKNVIRKSALLAESEEILPSNLPQELANIQNEPVLTATQDKTSSFEDTIKKVESELIKRALAQADGNKIKAAELLDMNRKTLYRKMKNLGL